MRLRPAACLALLSFVWVPVPGLGQGLQAPPPPLIAPPQVTGYVVTGRVICADTQRPARFAQVTLVPAQTAGEGEGDRGRRGMARTDLDGRFVMENVPPGDYFATAEMTGYINDLPAVQQAISAGGDALSAVSGVPRVQVSPGGGSAQISLQRGGVIAGAVQWDDGSPAAGVQISAQPAPATGVGSTSATQAGNALGRPGGFNGYFNGGQTDDRGRYRLSGLAPGSYVVRANLQSPLPQTVGGDGRFARMVTLSVYAPNKLRRTDAAVVTLGTGEERDDLNMVLGLGGMHTVSGQVSSSAASVRSGSVVLTDQTDSTLSRRGSINPDGTFAVPYVPPGTYTLRINASAQAPNNGRGGNSSSDAATRFQPLQESLTVTDSDLTGVSVTVTVATASTQ